MRDRRKQPNTQSPAEKKLWKKIRANLAVKRRADRQKVKDAPSVPIEYSPSGDGLKRGPKKDTTRDDADKASVTVSAAITPNEYAVLEKFRLSWAIPHTGSRFIRFLITEAMRKCAVLGGNGAVNVATGIPRVQEVMEADPEVQVFLQEGWAREYDLKHP